MKKFDFNKFIASIKNFILKLVNIFKKSKEKIITIFYLVGPFIAMDLITRLFGIDIDFFNIYKLAPNLFNVTWIILFVGLTLSFKKKIGRNIYLVFSLLFLVSFLTNNVYYSLTKTFFDFNLIESASEGAPYILDTLKNCNFLVYLSFIFIIYLVIKGYQKIPYKTKNNYKLLSLTVVLFVILHIVSPMTLGKANEDLTWSTWSNPRNIYTSFNDNNKGMQIAGLFEYTFRNFYVTFFKNKKQENALDIEFLDSAFTDLEHKNNYTGKFKGKNLIFIQLEGIDDWLLTKKDTPTLYKLMTSGINFSKHYSYYNGGGSTFNSEFAVNTGFITPLSYTQNAYTFNKNSFPYSMANLFKKVGYSVNAFHMNTGEYYSRTPNYLNWGYDNYHGLIDLFDYKDNSYTLDRELILNEEFSNLMFNEDGSNFVDYIITYSNHMPFTNARGVCKLLYNLDNPVEENDDDTEDKMSSSVPSSSSAEEVIMSEEECARRQAKETDYMIELLLKELEEREILDDTVIVAFADHYLYTLENKSIVYSYKKTNSNLINKTPFFIWTSDTDAIKNTTIKEVTSQLNILPTVLNLFGIEYNPNNYIGEDALDSKYDGIVFFSDYSWYDGNVYVEEGIVTNNKNISSQKLEEKNYYISYISKKNDLALKYNYFKKKGK